MHVGIGDFFLCNNYSFRCSVAPLTGKKNIKTRKILMIKVDKREWNPHHLFIKLFFEYTVEYSIHNGNERRKWWREGERFQVRRRILILYSPQLYKSSAHTCSRSQNIHICKLTHNYTHPYVHSPTRPHNPVHTLSLDVLTGASTCKHAHMWEVQGFLT